MFIQKPPEKTSNAFDKCTLNAKKEKKTDEISSFCLAASTYDDAIVFVFFV